MDYNKLKEFLIKQGYKEKIVYIKDKEIFNFYNDKTKQGINLEIEFY